MSGSALNLTNIPPAWRVTPLFAVAQETSRKNLGLVERNLLSLSYGRIVRRDIETSEGLLPQSFEGYQIVEPGDTVLRLTDLQNDQRSLRTGLVPERGIITSAYLNLRPTLVEPRWLNLVLYAYDVNKAFYAMGGGLRQSMGYEDLRRLPIPLPPLEEQRRIANYLDDQTTRIDQTIQLRQQQLELIPELTQAATSSLFGKEIEQGLPLSAVATIFDTLHKTAPDVEGGGHWIAGTSSIRNGRLVQSALRETDGASFRQWVRRARPKADDLLLTREAPVGEVALLAPDDPAVAVGQRVVLIKPKPEWLGAFIRAVLMSAELDRKIGEVTQGSLHPHLNMSDIARIRIPALDSSNQAFLAKEHRRVLQLDQELRLALTSATLTLQERRRSLITAAVSGALDVSSASSRAVDVVVSGVGGGL